MRKLRIFVGALLILMGVTVAPALADDAGAVDWFESSAPSVVRSHAGEDLPNLSSEQISQIEVGKPVNAQEFTNQAESYNQSDLWVAPISVDDNTVGTVATRFVSGKSETEKVTGDTRFADALSDLPDGSTVVVEPQFGGSGNLGGWFLVGDTVSPLDPVARSVLAGEVSESLFQEVREDLLSSEAVPADEPDTETPQSSGASGVIRAVVIVLVVLLVVVGILVWLRRDLSSHERVRRRPAKPEVTGNEVKVVKRPQRKVKREEKNDEDSDD